MRVDWCVSSWFRIKNTHSLTLRVRVCVCVCVIKNTHTEDASVVLSFEMKSCEGSP